MDLNPILTRQHYHRAKPVSISLVPAERTQLSRVKNHAQGFLGGVLLRTFERTKTIRLGALLANFPELLFYFEKCVHQIGIELMSFIFDN